MNLQLSVITDIDPDSQQIHLTVTGTLTEANHQLLLRVLQQTQALPAGLEVLVDLTGTTSWEASAMDLLLWEIDHSDPDGPLPPVGFVVPAPPVSSPRTGATPGPRTVWTGAGRKAHGDDR
ncbi:hypothetical protein [Kocuria himachalensis]